jgi:predicted RNase H-like HicB family nuclease
MEMMLPLTIKIIIDKRSKDAPFIAYTPELDVASCGPNEEKARVNLKEAVDIVLEEAQKKGKLTELLSEMGFRRGKKTWIAPRISFEQFSFPTPR